MAGGFGGWYLRDVEGLDLFKGTPQVTELIHFLLIALGRVNFLFKISEKLALTIDSNYRFPL